jgi:RHS repeat-associated protein
MFGNAVSLAVDDAGIVYVADAYNNVVRRISHDGIITTIAGTGEEGYNGDGGAAIGSQLKVPIDIAIAHDGSLYIVDSWNNRLRRVAPPFPGYGNLLSPIVSEDGVEIYVFDQVGKHLRTEDALTRARLTSFSYDSIGRLAAIADIDSLVTTIERDSTGSPIVIVSPFGQRTTLVVGDSGYLASITNPASETVQFTYASDGLMQTMTDARDNLYQFTYDTTGRLIRDEDPAGGYKTLTRSELSNGFQVQVQTASSKSSRYRVQSVSTGGRIRTTTNATGLSTVTLETDNRKATTMPDGMVTVVDLLPDPRFGMLSPLMNTTVITPNGLQSMMTHNRFVTQMTGLEVTGLKDSVVINDRTYTTVYDGSTKTIESSSPEGRITVSTVDAKGRSLRDSASGISGVGYDYDAQGFLTATSQSMRTTGFSYDARGRLATVTDPLLRTAHMFYDSVGRVTRQVLADGREILYAYDASGNLTALAPPGRPAHGFEYTVVDLTHKYAPPEIPPDSNWATDYAYNLDRQITHTFLPDGDSIVVRYDTSGCGCGSLSRPAEIKFDRGTLVFTYDSATGNVMRIVGPGNDTLSYVYDGSLPLSASWSGNVDGSVAVKYDNDFRVIQQTVIGVDSVAFAYDQDGLVREAGDLKIKRDPNNGLFLGDTLGSVITNVGYNSFGEMSSYEARHGTTPLFATTYGRDSLGRITTLTETMQGVTTEHRYGYDLTGRLKQVWRNDTLQATYFYDPNGNRDSIVTQAGTTRGTYDAQDRMLTYGNASYFYTKRGSLSMKVEGTDTTRYTYDLLGNLTKVELSNSDVIEYLIDVQNRRVGKKFNGQVIARWIYSGQLAPVAGLDSSGNIAARFVCATHVNIPDYIVTDTATYRVLTDHLGSLRLVLNEATGTVMQRMDYDAWGNVTGDSNSGFTPFGYAGGMYEQQTELVRFGARDYDATSGRWTTKDPIGFRGGEINTYRYCGNEPTNTSDVAGLWSPEGHDRLLEHALGGRIPSTHLEILKREGRIFDNMTQDPTESYMHAMAEEDETPAQARNRTIGFECEALRSARYYSDRMNTELALYFLSHAMHPMMDATSPAHTDANGNPIVWRGMFSWGALQHGPGLTGGIETVNHITSATLTTTDQTLYNAYSYVFGR